MPPNMLLNKVSGDYPNLGYNKFDQYYSDYIIRAGGSVFRGGLKITRPKCIHLFSGGGQVSPGVS